MRINTQTIVLQRCDIFCHVIDNYGDIGVCWRLARQLAHEYDWMVSLWVDDLDAFVRLYSGANPALETQVCDKVQVVRWYHSFSDVPVADLVIEAFACQLPQPYIERMAAQHPQPIWINLEYLSAESWVQGCHRMPSPHPTLPITKHYFFPGFTRDTGGLLLEKNLLVQRDAFQSDAQQQEAFWRSLGMEMPDAGVLKVSLFGYENAALASLLNVWVEGVETVLCLVPEGRLVPQVAAYFEMEDAGAGHEFLRGNLRLRILPFVSQQQYDKLLWACDVNFVRGEDSFVRAQWAAKPLVWQIYPQHDQIHHDKLQAFLGLYTAPMAAPVRQAVQALWEAWNREQEVAQSWREFNQHKAALGQHAAIWAARLAENNLVGNLLDFYRELGKIRASRILDAKA